MSTGTPEDGEAKIGMKGVRVLCIAAFLAPQFVCRARQWSSASGTTVEAEFVEIREMDEEMAVE